MVFDEAKGVVLVGEREAVKKYVEEEKTFSGDAGDQRVSRQGDASGVQGVACEEAAGPVPRCDFNLKLKTTLSCRARGRADSKA